MSDAAQAELPKHEVFTSPFKVEPVYEEWDTPQNYRRYPGGKDLPPKVRVWRIQDTGERLGSIASNGPGMTDSPDAELLTEGYNLGKGPHEAGVSRHGNFLQWGFNGSPSQMTPAGKSFFLNCIVYIRKFDEKQPLIRVRANDRSAILYAAQIRIVDPEYMPRSFGPGLRAKDKQGQPETLAVYLEKNMEFIYKSPQGYEIDEELKSLGIASNRKLESLKKLIALRDDPAKKELAGKILKRYLDAAVTPETAKQWLTDNRDRIFFTDLGGYKFMAAPKGYLLPQ